MPRPFRSPWWAERSYFGYIVRDADGQILAFVPSRMTEAEAIEAEALTDNEARGIVSAIVQLPTLMERRRDTSLVVRDDFHVDAGCAWAALVGELPAT